MADIKPLGTLQSDFEVIRDEKRPQANTAERIGNAFLSLLPYLGEYLHKDRAETVQYLLTLLQGAVIGESGQIRLNPDGSITCGRIHVEGAAVFDEMVFNRQSVNEGDQVFTDRGVIEKVTFLGGGQYRLELRREYEDQAPTFKTDDCLKSKVNRLDKDRSHYTSWFRVLSVDYDASTLDVILYPDDEVPGGKNYPPAEAATVGRWGNPTDEQRQSTFFLSATDGMFCFLQGVTRPLINQPGEGNNTAAVIGLPPDVPAVRALIEEGTLAKDETVVYAQTLLAERFIEVRHDGTPVYQQREWDFWDPERQYIRGFDEDEGVYVQDNAWYGGSLWRCIVPKARVGVEPSLANTDWACIRSGGLALDIDSTEGDWFDAERSFTTTLVAMVTHGDLVVSEDDIEDVRWTRESGRDADDEAWDINQAKGTQSMQLAVRYDPDHPELSDIPVPATGKCGFRCTVTVAGRETSNAYQMT